MREAALKASNYDLSFWPRMSTRLAAVEEGIEMTRRVMRRRRMKPRCYTQRKDALLGTSLIVLVALLCGPMLYAAHALAKRLRDRQLTY